MSRSIRHRIELGEYRSTRLGGIAPTSADLALATRLADHGLTVRWLRGDEVEIAASSWVGAARFTNFDAVVVPKLVGGGGLNVLRMIEYASGVDILKLLPENRPLPFNGDDLVDLICLLLAEESRAVIHAGVIRDYREVEDSLTVLRGRLRHRDQMTRRFNQVHVLECGFDEYDADVPDNQLLAAALSRARRLARTSDVSYACAQLADVLSSVCVPPTSDSGWYRRRIRNTRRNQHYRAAHELAYLVLGGFGVSDLFQLAGQDVAAFFLDMNAVFEAFVTRLVRDALAPGSLTVANQAPLGAVIRDDLRSRPYTTIRPDLIVTSPTGSTIPIDVKYKIYDQRSISTGDIFQTFVYAYALGQPGTIPRAGIIYPAAEAARAPALSVHRAGSVGPEARIVGVGLDVPLLLAGLRSPQWPDLLGAIRHDVDYVLGEELDGNSNKS